MCQQHDELHQADKASLCFWAAAFSPAAPVAALHCSWHQSLQAFALTAAALFSPQSLPSTLSIAGMSPRRWDQISNASRSTSNLTDLDQPSSPNGSERSLHSTIETFDE